VHVAVWPALFIVPLHPSENVVVSGAITETVSLIRFVTYKKPLSGLKAIPIGVSPTGMGDPTTVFVVPSITETVSSAAFVTYRLPLMELKAMPLGLFPTGIVSITNPGGALLSIIWYVTGKGGFIF
jgi:hypothetical protein